MPKPVGNKARSLLKGGARLLEEVSYTADTVKLPLVRKYQERGEKKLFGVAREMRCYAGEKPRTYKLQRHDKDLEM